MSIETAPLRRNPEQRAMSFIKDMRAVKFDGPRGKFDLDSFVLLTYDQKTKTDEVEFVSWAEDSSRIEPDYLVFLLNSLQLPKNKDHAPYPQTALQYYENLSRSQEEKKVPAIAFGTGAKGRTVLYRLKGLSTKDSFERLKNNPVIARKIQHMLLTFSQSQERENGKV